MRCLRRRSTALTRFSTAECPTPNSFATTEYGVPSRTRTSIAIPLADEFELIKLMSWRVGRHGAYCDWAAQPRKAHRTARLLARLAGQMGKGAVLSFFMTLNHRTKGRAEGKWTTTTWR